MSNQPQQQPQQVPFNVNPEILKGVYTNNMTVMHTKEEFILDFMNVSYNPNAVTLGAKVISSPEHFKRIVAALQDNLKKYEEKFGPVESPEPAAPPVVNQQEQSESSKFWFK